MESNHNVVSDQKKVTKKRPAAKVLKNFQAVPLEQQLLNIASLLKMISLNQGNIHRLAQAFDA